ncbi:uncharacterized protein LTR77_007851 [Saxophila tyrrhenica]|uniref:SnoaL-like domain-containing protein n=1 Tax=Saxophila tyrrhenica TaxID=1690608 RepID=A0AAV9P411_9PEZI|nr:hypothetical protein LTR77_007851 [Saxophila tyrrhenica]
MTVNPIDYIAIQNTIAKYCFALDEKNFDGLKDVFTEDVDTIYPFRGTIKGVATVADAIKKRLTPVTTQHALTTQHIAIAENGRSANVTTYFTGIHFGQGKWSGSQRTAYGKYIDQLRCVEGIAADVPGASGKWLIERREVLFMGELGEHGVMEGE